MDHVIRQRRKIFLRLQELLGESTVFLIDTYDTLEGARLAARLGRPLWGVRLDSGDLVSLSREVRGILDDAGLHDAKIFATNDLDEHRISQLLRDGACLDAFGVGTQLATSADAPSLGAVYKLVELKKDGAVQYTAKFSDEKATLPGAKQIYRYPRHDVIALYSECNSDFEGQPMLRPVLINGELVERLPSIETSKQRAKNAVSRLPSELLSLEKSVPYRVDISGRLLQLAETLRRQHITVS